MGFMRDQAANEPNGKRGCNSIEPSQLVLLTRRKKPREVAKRELMLSQAGGRSLSQAGANCWHGADHKQE